MVMQCGMKRKHDCLLDSTIDIERHQQSLLELSVQKLQEEQVKYGVEPRLLRFVLINNAMRALQSHLMRFESEESFGLFENLHQDAFLLNTINHGLLLSPPSPPTPVKVPKIDNSPFSSDSPLINSCSFPHLGCSELDDIEHHIIPPLPSLASPLEVKDSSLAARKRSADRTSSEDEEKDNNEDCKRQRPNSLCLIDDTLSSGSKTDDHLSLSGSSSSSLSPIDFAKVDVSLYDFDARTNLIFPPAVATPAPSAPPSLSCSVQAYVTSPEPDNNEPSETSTSTADNSSTSSRVSSNESNSDVPSSSHSPSSLSTESSEVENTDENHEIDRIVSLLMA